MKKLVLLSITILSLFSCSTDNIQNEPFEQTSNLLLDSRSLDPKCREFGVEVGIGVFTITTTVYVCCGDAFVNPGSALPPCQFVSEETYESLRVVQTDNNTIGGPGIPASNIIGRQVNTNENHLEILGSSSAVLSDGSRVRVKLGQYNIDANGYVHLEYENVQGKR